MKPIKKQFKHLFSYKPFQCNDGSGTTRNCYKVMGSPNQYAWFFLEAINIFRLDALFSEGWNERARIKPERGNSWPKAKIRPKIRPNLVIFHGNFWLKSDLTLSCSITRVANIDSFLCNTWEWHWQPKSFIMQNDGNSMLSILPV